MVVPFIHGKRAEANYASDEFGEKYFDSISGMKLLHFAPLGPGRGPGVSTCSRHGELPQ